MGLPNDAVCEPTSLALEKKRVGGIFSGGWEEGRLHSNWKRSKGLGGLNARKKKFKLDLKMSLKPSCDSRQLGVFKALGLKLIWHRCWNNSAMDVLFWDEKWNFLFWVSGAVQCGVVSHSSWAGSFLSFLRSWAKTVQQNIRDGRGGKGLHHPCSCPGWGSSALALTLRPPYSWWGSPWASTLEGKEKYFFFFFPPTGLIRNPLC